MNETADRSIPAASSGELLVINQVAGPLMYELLEDLQSAGIHCRVLTGWVDCPAGKSPSFEVTRACPLNKTSLSKRLMTWGRFTLRALATMLLGRATPMLIVTNPPLVMLLAPLARWLRGRRYTLLIYDIYPDVAERTGQCKPNGLAARLWRRLSRRAMLKAERVITLGDYMAETLRGHLREGDSLAIDVIPNWADPDEVRPIARQDNSFARQHGLVGKFVVTYSGAFGATHDIDSIVLAAERLGDCDDIQFMLIGGGTRRQAVEQLVAEKQLRNLKLLPFQPRDALPLVLAASDCAIVTLGEGYEGISVPSKTYFALAAGTALLAVCGRRTELAELANVRNCGIHVPPRNPEALEAAIRQLHDDDERLAACKQASRTIAETETSREILTAKYLQLLCEAYDWSIQGGDQDRAS